MILVLGGTSDALDIASELFSLTGNVIYSTATEYGYCVTEKKFRGKIIYGRKDNKQLRDLVFDNKIGLVVDATHPFAVKISENAMDVCFELGIEYVRYERKNSVYFDKEIILCESFEQAGKIAEVQQGVIFITTGSKDIEKIIQSISDPVRVMARVLPISESIIKLEKLNLNSDNIIGMRGPFTFEMNYQMFKNSNAAVMICKDSGEVGGTHEKIKAAAMLGIITIMIKRPSIEYINKFDNIYALKTHINTIIFGKEASQVICCPQLPAHQEGFRDYKYVFESVRRRQNALYKHQS